MKFKRVHFVLFAIALLAVASLLGYLPSDPATVGTARA